MHCVSKCFVKGKSLRMYSLLFLGMVVGLSISTVIHSVELTTVHSGVGTIHKVEKVIKERGESRNGGRVKFSNLQNEETADKLGENYQAQNIEFGGYEYEREAESMNLRQSSELDVNVRVSSLTVAHPEVIDKWHGKNVQEASIGIPPNKLSDELLTRQTYLIAVITSTEQLMTQTLSIHGTWGFQSVLANPIFFVGKVDILPHLPHGMNVVQLEGVDDVTADWEVKEIATVKYLMDHYLNRVDWFVITNDLTYIVTDHLKKLLDSLDANRPVYMGYAGKLVENKKRMVCERNPGIVYSQALLQALKPYLPMCWPGQGEMKSLSGCISVMGVKCTQARETHNLFLSEARLLVESDFLSKDSELAKAVAVYPVKHQYMYRLHSFYMELEYNRTIERTKVLIAAIQSTRSFIPSHLRSHFKLQPPTSTPVPKTIPSPTSNPEGGVVLHKKHTPKNKFEINYWEYFNQTRIMSIMHESPARGIIGGVRDEARFALTKAIYQANQGIPQAHRYVFDKLENGYHRVDPMRGSEFILDFVFRKQSNKHVKVKKRLSILRPYHETVVPLSSAEMLPTVNFLVTLSGLTNRLEHFLWQYETNVLQPGEDATLTIVLFESPDAAKVRLMVQQYLVRYQGAKMTVIDVQGEFTRGVGLDHGLGKFNDDQLVFIVDVDLNISTDFLQRCRLNTIQGTQVYFPVFFKLYNKDFVDRYHKGNHSLLISRHRGHWAHYSYGMVCIYAADYRKSGGFDVAMRGWGEEDVDLLNKVMGSGLEVFRAPDPGLIHNWHSKNCNKEQVTNSAAYKHCLQSKGENLADRIELAQYVFENELRNGNVL